MNVIIVGGGCAGLMAAHTLKMNGVDVLVLEKEKQAGGRMTTFKRDGFDVDVAAQLVHPGYKMARMLMTELGMIDQLIKIDVRGMKIITREGKLINAAPVANPKEIVKTMKWLSKMGLRNLARLNKWVTQRCKKSMYEGSADWLIDVDMGGDFASYVRREYGEAILEGFVQPVIGAIALDYPENIGIGLGLQIMWTVLCGEAATLKNGLGSLAQHIIDRYPGMVMGDTSVRRIIIQNNKVTGVETEQGIIDADIVLCATPATQTLGIIPNLPKSMRAALSTVAYCPTIHAIIFVDDRNMVNNGLGGVLLPRYTGSPISAISMNSVKSPNACPPGKEAISNFIYGDGCKALWNKSDQEVTEVVCEQLRKFTPCMPKEILFSHIVRFTQANYIMPSGSATAIKDMRDNHYRDVEGLFLAGEYMYTGSYESALNAGRHAAEAILGKRKSI